MKEKLLSGRYFLTVVAGLVFAYSAYTKLLNAEAVAAIVTMVFINYFQRDRKSEENGKGEIKPTITIGTTGNLSGSTDIK